MATKLLFPILNKNVTLFKLPTIYLDTNVHIQQISPDDYYVIKNDLPDEFNSLIPKNCKVIIINDIDIDSADEIVKFNGTALNFVFNYFKHESPISISYAIQLTQKRKLKIDKVIDIDSSFDSLFVRKKNYNLRKNVASGTFAEFYKVLSVVNNKYKGLLLTLDRFNSALVRKDNNDKLVDITIALESLINGNAELRYKFSLYNSIASENDPVKRKIVYDLLISLYDARSAIVHGSALSKKEFDKKIKPIIDKWEDVVKIAENTIGYYLLYMYNNDINAWYKHQENLALNIDTKII